MRARDADSAQSMSRSRLMDPQDAQCMHRQRSEEFFALSDFTSSSVLLVSKKKEGSLTAREAALLAVSEAFRCVFCPSHVELQVSDSVLSRVS
jgi:hypothetical protein